MEYIEKIKFLSDRFELTHVQLSAMLGMSRNRCRDIINGKKDINDKDKMRIDRAMKVQKMLSKHNATEEEITIQFALVDNLKDKIQTKDNEKDLIGVITEAMYLGLMLANNNLDEIALKRVRAWRK